MVNTVYLVGRIGKDPESKKVGDKFVTNFSVATSESYNRMAQCCYLEGVKALEKR